MKLVCVSNGKLDGASFDSVNLTLGKIYEALGDNVSHSDFEFRVINDLGDRCRYHSGRFIALDESRSNKLKELGI